MAIEIMVDGKAIPAADFVVMNTTSGGTALTLLHPVATGSTITITTSGSTIYTGYSTGSTIFSWPAVAFGSGGRSIPGFTPTGRWGYVPHEINNALDEAYQDCVTLAMKQRGK